MSSKEVSEYWVFRNIIKFLLLVVGLWPIKHHSRVPRLLSFISLLLSTVTSIGVAGYVRANSTNILLVAKSLSIMMSFITVILKITSIMIHREDVSELHEILDSHFNKLLNDPFVSSLILNGLRIRRYLALTLTILLLFVSLTYPVTLIISIVQQYVQHIHPMTYSLPYPAVYPWPTDPPGFCFVLQSMIETVATVPLGMGSAGIDSLFTLYGFQMVGQLREMSYRITHIATISDDETIVRECVLQHSIIMKCRDKLQKIYGPPILLMMAANSIVLCNVIFQITQMNVISIPKIMWISAYVVLKIIQTFMYAWTGTCLTIEDEKYRNAVYSCDWQRNKFMMKCVIIILTQKLLVLTACDFAIVSLSLFTSVLNSTISYYFLLQTLQTTPSVTS